MHVCARSAEPLLAIAKESVMHPVLLHHHVDERRQRLMAAAAVHRALPPRPGLRVRGSAVRRSVGFRLVEAGLRLALAQGDELPKLRRSA